jgi:Tol biopolymer transport system component
MPLAAGTKLGPYEVLAPIGAGGMGEVYRATDTRLNRTVAIKVLPPQFTNNIEMKQRFDREAQVIAGLNHPHICTLYDIGRQEGTDFLVMEYLEGETLSHRLERGPLPLDEALKVGLAVADALDKAHGQGITHRDLKPGNIMLTAGGAKLLDFGLAKLEQPAQSGDPRKTPASLSATAPGMILGTLQYMAPEQLEGKEADARTDIFAFGSVLYEMLTGRKAFEGKSQPHLIAAIMSVEPDAISKSKLGTPPALEFLVKRCLAKDPEQRLQTATDLVAELEWIAGGTTESGAATRAGTSTARRIPLPYVALVVAVLFAIGVAAAPLLVARPPNAREETRFLISVPNMPVVEALAISPDGRQVAYSATDGGTNVVFVRPLNSQPAQRLAGTDGAGRLFWSPDSRWIAFFAGGKLKKIDASGGPPQNICETTDLLGGTWNADGMIVFATSKGLQRVLAAGGNPSRLSTTGDAPREPYFLPDGRHYLFLGGKEATAAIYTGSIDANEATKLLAAQSPAVYAEPGYLLYHRDGTLYAQPFSGTRRVLEGDAVRLADRIPQGSAGAAPFAASSNGVLVYRNDPQQPIIGITPDNVVPDRPLRWVARNGTGEQAAAPAGWVGADVSPDGKRAVVHRHEAGGGDLWIFTTGETTPSKFTFDATQDNSSPVWSPDGTRIAFASRRNGKWGLYVKPVDNTRNEDLVVETELPAAPMSWSGNRIVYSTSGSKTSGDVWSVVMGDAKAAPILQTPADERTPQVSPDGRWMAYSSNETGRSEIYIRPFPEGPGKIQVSVNGGVFPRWRRDGKELFFMSLVSVGSMMAADIRVAGASVERGVPRVLFQTVYVTTAHGGSQHHAYAVSADGQRFLIPQLDSVAALGRGGAGGLLAALTGIVPAVSADRHASAGPAAQTNAPITVVLDWTAALRNASTQR